MGEKTCTAYHAVVNQACLVFLRPWVKNMLQDSKSPLGVTTCAIAKTMGFSITTAKRWHINILNTTQSPAPPLDFASMCSYSLVNAPLLLWWVQCNNIQYYKPLGASHAQRLTVHVSCYLDHTADIRGGNSMITIRFESMQVYTWKLI